LLVAAHHFERGGPPAEGLRTAFIPRPLEHGPDAVPDLTPDPSFDVVAADLVDLARQMGT